MAVAALLSINCHIATCINHSQLLVGLHCSHLIHSAGHTAGRNAMDVWKQFQEFLQRKHMKGVGVILASCREECAQSVNCMPYEKGSSANEQVHIVIYNTSGNQQPPPTHTTHLTTALLISKISLHHWVCMWGYKQCDWQHWVVWLYNLMHTICIAVRHATIDHFTYYTEFGLSN